MTPRTPRNEMLRRARQHARDERALPVAIPVCGGWARVRCAKSLLYHLTNDQAIDIIAGLSESDTREADLKQLDDAGIVQTTSALTTSAEPRATADLGAAEALPITTAAAFAEDMGALQADLEAMPVAEAVATSISDDATAERIIARILDREAQRKRIAIQAEAMDRELANDIRGLAWRFGIPLEEWARRNLRGKARSHKTLLGTAGFAKIAARWSVEDARAVEAWALAQDDPEKFGRYGFALEPAAVLAYAKATGEAIPGLKLSAERETFYLKGDVRVDVTKARSAPALPEPGNPEEE